MAHIPQWCDQSPRARHPGMGSQVGLRKHHYEQSFMKLYEQIFNRKIQKKEKNISKKNVKSSCKEGYAILLRFFKCLKQKEK